MHTNDLNNAYVYECERRNDERWAAAESQKVHNLLGRKRKPGLPIPMTITGILTTIIILLRIF